MLCVKKSIFFSTAEPTQLLAPTVDSNQTDTLGRCPWCWDEAAPWGLGVTVPQATQSAIAQLIVVCKKIDLICLAVPPQLLTPTVESNQTNALGHCPWCWDEAAPCGLGGPGPQATQSAIAQLIVVCKKIDWIYLAEPPQLLASTVDFDKTDALGHRPWCWDEAAPCRLGGAGPQAMQSARAAGHHGVLFTLKKVIWKKMWSGQRSARGLLAKPTNRPVILYIRFFMYQGYDILFFREAHCSWEHITNPNMVDIKQND